jgi:plastocyanin
MLAGNDITSLAPRMELTHPRRWLAGAGLALVAVLFLVAVASTSPLSTAPTLQAPHAATEAVVVAAVPTNGVISFTIPRGATDVQQAGGRAYVIPAAMRLEAGDRVVVHNDDLYPHLIFTKLVMPGTTETMTFNEPGIHPFSSGCAVHGGMLNAFTSVIVSER